MVKDANESIEKFQDFFEEVYKHSIDESAVAGKKFLLVDFFDITKFDHELAEELLESPDEMIKAAELAIAQIDSGKHLRIRIKNLPQSQKVYIRNLRASHLGEFICIEGIIRQASDIRPKVVSARFECPSCGNTITMLQTDQKFREPTRCSCGRKGHFKLLEKELIDAQRIVLEESSNDLESGGQPRRLAIFLREDLVEPKMEKRTTPGSGVRVNGILDEIPVPTKDGGTSTTFDIIMNANYLEPIEEDFSDIEIKPDDIADIKALANDKNIYQKLVKSIAPTIYGHEMIKEAIALQLFGATRKINPDGTSTRGDVHILLCGDPGSGKSQLLTFVQANAPKVRYVAGKSSSGAGLTAAVVKDEFLRGWALEAGAMVLADKGLLAIDEMDKMTDEDTSALHQAMEQQCVTIAKANIQATLRCQTSVLAAANPKFGRFDPYQPIAKQIDMPSPLINRFDLMFIVRDKPDKERDSRIAHQILKKSSYQGTQADIKPEILRKYIAYAKKTCNPILEKEALEEIKNFYVDLRNSGQTGDEKVQPIPISARQLEAIVRLAEASAKVRLSNVVTVDDAQRGIRLLRATLMEVGIDPETGKLDIDRISGAMPASERGKVITVRDIIFKMDEEGKKTIPINDIMAEAMKRGIKQEHVEEALEKLKRTGDIFQPKQGFVQKI